MSGEFYFERRFYARAASNDSHHLLVAVDFQKNKLDCKIMIPFHQTC